MRLTLSGQEISPLACGECRLIRVDRRPPRTAADAVRILAHVRRLRRVGSDRAQDKGRGSGSCSMLTSGCVVSNALGLAMRCGAETGTGAAVVAAGRFWVNADSLRVCLEHLAADMLAICLCRCRGLPAAGTRVPDCFGPPLHIRVSRVQGWCGSTGLIWL